jgi:hypothetical protein
MRKFRSQGEHALSERVLNVARLGKRRAEMISRNQKSKRTNARKKKRSPIGSASGLKTPTPSSIGSTCESSLPNSNPNFLTQEWKNELSR